MYKKMLDTDCWSGSPIPEGSEGFPLTHDILERLDVLHMTGENPVGSEAFEDDYEKIQQSLIESGASYVQQHRRSTSSSDSEPELAHADSPPPSHSSRMSISSSGSRKRSSPPTPPPPQMEDRTRPSKRREFQGFGIQSMEPMPMFYQEPMVMTSPSFSEPSIDFSIYDTTEMSNSGYNMFDSMAPMNVKAITMPTQNPMQNFLADDPEYGYFIQSGYQGQV